MPGWRRTFRAVWIANLVTSMGMMSFLPFFPEYLRALGVTDEGAVAVWAGAIYGAAPLTAGLMMPIWGAVGDRYGRKPMVLRSMLAIAVFVGAMAWATAPWQLFALRICQGLFSGFVAPSVTLVSVQAPADRQGTVAGTLQTAMAVGSAAGPFLGGLLANAVGLHNVFLCVATAALVSAGIVTLYAQEGPREPIERAARPGAIGVLQATLREGVGAFGHPSLRGALILLFAMQLGMGATNPQLATYVRELLGRTGEGAPIFALLARGTPTGGMDDVVRLGTSVLFAGIATVSLFAMPLWGRIGDRRGHGAMLLPCAAACLVMLLSHAFVPGYGSLVVVQLLLGAAVAGLGPLAFGIAAGEIAAAQRGGAFGAVVSARTLAISLGSIVGGAVAALVGVRWLYVLGAVVVAGALVDARSRGIAARVQALDER